MSGRALRIGIDGRAFHSPAAGVRRYVTELTRAIAGLAEPGVELVTIDATGPSAPTNLGRHATALPMAIRAARVDLFHAPAYTAPLWGATPIVLSVHDVSYARHPEWYPYRRDPLRRWFYRRSARRAALIVTISEFSKREIIAAYDIPPERIVVTPLGVSDQFRPREPGDSAADPPFLLHVGDLHARRNLGVVVRAMARWAHNPTVAGSNPAPATNLRLVLAGVDRGLAGPLLDEAAGLGLREAIDICGRVVHVRSDADRISTYADKYPRVFQ